MATNFSYLDALDRMRKPSRAKVAGFIEKKPASRSTQRTDRKVVGNSLISGQPISSRTSAPRKVVGPSLRPGGAVNGPAARTGGGAPSSSQTRTTQNVAPPRPPRPSRPPGGTNTGLSVPNPGARVAAPTGGGSYNYSSVAASPTGQYGGAPLEGGGLPAPMSDEEYLPTDSIYVSEAAGINSDVQSLLDSLKRDRSTYDVDFGSALRNLGWDLGEGGLSDPTKGQWRQQDMTGAYGAAYNNQQNDFAGRGMLTSSFYGNALEDLLSSFDRQRGDMIGARQRQFDDYTAQESQAENQRRQGLDRARAAALARRAAGLSLGGV